MLIRLRNLYATNTAVIARLDRAIQYSAAPIAETADAAEYWMPRLRGA